MGGKTLLTVAVLSGFAFGAAAEPVTLAFTEFYPVTRTENGQPAGPGLDVARKLTEGLSVEIMPEATPLRRLMVMTETKPFIVAALVRTSAREDRFRWIGELYRDSLVMVTRKPHARIDDLDSARRLGHIGVTLGGVAQSMLEERHFHNVEPSQDMTAQARKLANGRVDAWCGLKQSVRESWTVIGKETDDLEIGAEIVPVSIWIAASLPVPIEMVEEMRRRFAQMQRDGTLDRILAGLR